MRTRTTELGVYAAVMPTAPVDIYFTKTLYATSSLRVNVTDNIQIGSCLRLLAIYKRQKSRPGVFRFRWTGRPLHAGPGRYPRPTNVLNVFRRGVRPLGNLFNQGPPSSLANCELFEILNGRSRRCAFFCRWGCLLRWMHPEERPKCII